MRQSNEFNKQIVKSQKNNDALNYYYKSKRRKHNRVAKRTRAMNARIRKHR